MTSYEDIGILLAIVLLEGILSVDNAVILAALAQKLPHPQQARALKFGMAGAIIFRILAVWLAQDLLQRDWINYLGGSYLIFLGAKHLLRRSNAVDLPMARTGVFWKVVLQIELTDMIFSIDSIVAAVGLSKKYWIIIAGGILGIILMRFISSLFIKVLKSRPMLESSAYAVVILVGAKVILEAAHIPNVDFHSTTNPAFYVFWIMMISIFSYGFLRKPLP